MTLVPYDRPRGTIHDLAHILDLAACRVHLLCVSDRTLYILHNLAALDVKFASRYAVDLLEHGYEPVDPDSPLWSVFMSTYENLGLEVMPVDCDLLVILSAIAQTLDNLQVGVDYPLAAVPYFDPPPNDEAAPEPSPKCQAAWSAAWNWQKSANELFDKRTEMGTLGVGIVSLILAAINLPMAAVFLIAVSLAELILLLDKKAREAELEGLVGLVACAIWTAPTVSFALAQVRLTINANLVFDNPTKAILCNMWSYNLINAIFEGTYPIVTGAPTDCTWCGTIECGEVYFHDWDNQELAPWYVLRQDGGVTYDLSGGEFDVTAAGTSPPSWMEIELDLSTDPILIQTGHYISWYVERDVTVNHYCIAYFEDDPEQVVVIIGGPNQGSNPGATMTKTMADYVGRKIIKLAIRKTKTAGGYHVVTDTVKLICL